MPNEQINSNFLLSKYGKLHYYKYGNGEKVLLIFHGFGQDHEIAIPIAELLDGQYTIYSFDLPYHGKSTWAEEEVQLTKEILGEMFSEWLKQKKISAFSTLGYSMGGKFSLALSALFPEQVEQSILIAPDGLHKSIWYSLATSFPIKSLFKYTIDHPSFFFSLTNFISKTGIAPSKLVQFSVSQMATSKLRKQVFYTWTNFQELYTNKQTLDKLVNTHQIKIRLILGAKDTIINLKRIRPFVKRIQKINPDILPSGHGRLVQESAPLIKKYLLP